MVQIGEDLLVVKNLKKHFPIKKSSFFNFSKKPDEVVKAVDGLSFTIKKGETLGMVGESGCGKSTAGRLILRLIDPTAGQVSFDGRDVLSLNSTDMRNIRKEMQIVFQNPYASLDPRMTVGDSIAEPIKIHKTLIGGSAVAKRVRELLEIVGLRPQYADRYPHEFSGGQRQRIGIARALAVNPKFIIADEPVSALDVSVQAQVLNLLEDLQKEYGLTYLFIAHNLSTVKHISDRVAVMYLGNMVELTDSDELYKNPLHPYTKALLSAIPITDPTVKIDRILLEGDIPSPVNPPSGCKFHTRCFMMNDKIKDRCKKEVPEFVDTGDGHFVACHLYEASK